MEAQYVAQENARRFQDRYPLAAETVVKSTYMDNSIDSLEDEPTAETLQKELQELWKNAGIEARKWSLISSKLWEQSQKSIEHLNWQFETKINQRLKR